MAGRSTSWLIRPLATVVAAACIGGAPQLLADEVDDWVGQLGAAQFARREAAARSLVGVGKAATDPLERAIRGGDLEVSSRGIDVLRQMLDLTDEATVVAAEESLERLARDGDDAVQRLAAAATEFHRLGRSAEGADQRPPVGPRRRVAVGVGLVVQVGEGVLGRHGAPVPPVPARGRR
jgi:hypothetical protein